MFLFDQVLISPSHEELLRTVREAGAAACQTAHWGPDEFVPPAPATFFERWGKDSRVVGHRGTLSEGERQNLFCPGDEDRPDLCLVYPDHAFVRRDWLARDLWVACPCGMAGLPQRLGWMGPCCAACHDRREEGM